MANNQGGDGPFEPGDRTVLKPRPGAGRAGSSPPGFGGAPASIPPVASAPTPAPPLPPMSAGPASSGLLPPRVEIGSSRMDPLYHAAVPLLLLAGNLRHATEPLETAGLRRQLVGEVRAFEERAKAAGSPADQIGAARYALCASLDEAVLATPWGANSDWGTQSMLVTFHRETWGGEKFFQLIDRTRDDPARYGGLLEILYACLSLGFAGKYALDPQGPLQRDRLQHELHEWLRGVRGPVAAPLSPHWEGVKDKRMSIVRYVPWWVVAAAGLVILTGAYVYFRTQLSHKAEPLLATLSQVGLEGFGAAPAPAVKPAFTLKQLLAKQESQRQLQVEEEGAKSTVILASSDLFASGSAQVSERYRDVLAQVATALNQIPGPVVVVGHSDDQPVRSFRYQNNFELSAARAQAVVDVLRPLMTEPSRLRSTGMGSTQPRYLPPDIDANRALNRRVEILHVASGAVAP